MKICHECWHDIKWHYHNPKFIGTYTPGEIFSCEAPLPNAGKCSCVILTIEEVTDQMIPKEYWEGLGPDSPIVENANGGKQSKLNYRCDLFDGSTMLRLAAILDYGAKRYEPNNWRKIPVDDHINHALVHLMAYLANDKQDDHLGHALCRLMFACATEPTAQTTTGR